MKYLKTKDPGSSVLGKQGLDDPWRGCAELAGLPEGFGAVPGAQSQSQPPAPLRVAPRFCHQPAQSCKVLLGARLELLRVLHGDLNTHQAMEVSVVCRE